MITFQKYIRPQTLDEAYQLNQVKNNRIVAGMLWLKGGNINCVTAIDLCDLGLNKIEENEEEFSIGAMVTLRQIEQHKSLNEYSNHAICDSVKDIVGVQFRNLATVGGSIWGRFGFSDVLTVFLSMDSYVELYKGGIIPLEKFAEQKYDSDILVRLIIKKKTGSFIYNAMRAQRTDFPVLTCAVSCIDQKYRFSIGARPDHAVVIYDDTGILENGINKDSAAAMSDYVAKTVKTSGNLRGSEKYRKHLAKVLTERNLLKLGGLS